MVCISSYHSLITHLHHFRFEIKTDRASVVGDAINYMKEMRRAIDHLKVLVEKKRRGMTSCKRLKTEEEEPVIDMESSSIKPVPFNGSSKSSWLLRKSKEAIVDVCIIDNEINIKLIQRKKGNCFLLVARVVDELQLEVTGGKVGEYYVFNFKSKVIIIFIVSVLNNLIILVYMEMLVFPVDRGRFFSVYK